MKRKIITKIAILAVPVAMVAFHYFFLAPYLFSLGNATADKYANAFTLMIVGALAAAIVELLVD